MAGLITVAELEGRLGHTLLGGRLTQAVSLIDDASAIVREIASPHLDDVDPPNVPPLIVTVMVAMVRRAQVNPLARSGEAIDGHQWQAGGQTGVFANDIETKKIRRAVGKLGAGSIVMEGDLPIHPRQGLTSFDDELSELFPSS